MWWWATVWILSIFYTSLTLGIKAITGLIPIQLHLQKLSGRNQLWIATLSHYHIIKLLLERSNAPKSQLYYLMLGNMIFKQQQRIKDSIVDINNQLHKIFTTFDSLNFIFYLCYRLIDNYSSHISINSTNYSSNESKNSHWKKLNEIILEFSSDLRTIVVISYMSIKNNVVSSISHIHSFSNLLKKTIHHIVNITPTETELFTIRYSINQTVQV